MNTDPRSHSAFDAIPDPARQAAPAGGSAPLPRLELAPTRRKVRSWRVAALLLSVTWLAANLGVYGLRGDLVTLSAGYIAAQIVLPFGLGLLALLVALLPGRSGLGLSVAVVSATALLAPLLFALIVYGAPPPRVAKPGETSWLSAAVCFDITLAWAAVPLLFLALALRRAFPVAAVWRSALLGVAAGLFAAGVMNLHCANVARFHLTFGHVVPALLAALVAAVLVRRAARA